MIDFKVSIKGGSALDRRMDLFFRKLPALATKGVRLQALRLRTLTVKGIRNQAPGGQAFRPLADSTKLMKGSSKALINRGDLVRSIGVDNVGASGLGSAFFVGVNRSARGQDGQELVNIAAVHEFGSDPYLIPVTDKLRRFWFAMYMQGIFDAPLSPHTDVIIHPGVPARPYLQPSFDEWERDANRQFALFMAHELRKAGA